MIRVLTRWGAINNLLLLTMPTRKLFDCRKRVTGEEWLVEKPGAYLRGVWEEVCKGVLMRSLVVDA